MGKLAEKYNLYHSQLEKFLHEKNIVAEVFGKIEERTKVNRTNIALGCIAFIAVYLVIGWGSQFLCDFIGFIFPAYASIKAIESKEKDDDTKWLTYWVAYSSFSLAEFFTDILFFWIPFYWLLKCMLLLWLMSPGENNGALLVYYKFIRPYVLKHQEQIDSHLSTLKKDATDLAGEAKQAATDAAADKAFEGLTADTAKVMDELSTDPAKMD